ncbi:MAG: HDOD domain-containing protein [Acidobacteria bacterium]|nr:HDOD domain-containing protein [Acidobacteriota bacterium]
MALVEVSKQQIRDRAVKWLHRLPEFSTMIGQVLLRLSHPDCEVREVAAIIERDPVLAAQVLRVANSGLYGRLRRISAVHHAITMVGINTVRRHTLAYTVGRLFGRHNTASTFSSAAFNAHSTATGLLADLMGKRLPVPEADFLFSAGLLHDLGRLLLAISIPREYDDCMEVAAISRRNVLESEREILGVDHVELSVLGLEVWKMPEALINAVAHHHRPEEDPLANSRIVTMSAVIAKADSRINYMGISPCSWLASTGDSSLEFPGHAYDRERVVAAFDFELESLLAMAGYQGTWLRKPPSVAPLDAAAAAANA